jgi:hypothetical protein
LRGLIWTEHVFINSSVISILPRRKGGGERWRMERLRDSPARGEKGILERRGDAKREVKKVKGVLTFSRCLCHEVRWTESRKTISWAWEW